MGRVPLSMVLRLAGVLLAASHTILAAPPPGSFVSLGSRQLPTNTSDLNITASGWYPSWVKGYFPPTQIPWRQYTEVSFSFAFTTPNGSLDLQGEDDTLRTFVEEAKKNNVKPLISIGGWTGSRYFSSAVATPENRTAFVKTVVDMVSKFNLSGVDLDWEYPNMLGVGDNVRSPNDSQNYLLFMQELRRDSSGANMTISAAGNTAPFSDAKGNPSTDMSGFAEVLDHLAILAYDMNGLWNDPPRVGSNAPLKSECSAGTTGSVEEAIRTWIAAKFPANKLLLGVPAYGRSYVVNPGDVLKDNNITRFNPPFDKSKEPAGEVPPGGGDSLYPSGVFTFGGLIREGYLTAEGIGTSNVTSSFDNCTQTPFLYSKSNKLMVSYEDARSWEAKAQVVKDQGLSGFAVWHVAGDSPDNMLLDSVHDTLGTHRPEPGGNSTNSTEPVPDKVVLIAAGWYHGELKAHLPPDQIPWELYTDISFGFGQPVLDNKISLIGEEDTLRTFTQLAREKNVKSLLTIGGWLGSMYFSPSVSTPENRAAFVKSVTDIVTEYQLDGVEFDWAFPNTVGYGCNQATDADTGNYLSFLQLLRQDPVGANMIIRTVGRIYPFDLGSSGLPNLSGFAEVVNQHTILGHELQVRKGGSVVSANGALMKGCPAGVSGSIEDGVDSWEAAGFPRNKLILGGPATSHSYKVTPENVLANGALSRFDPPFDTSVHLPGDFETSDTVLHDMCQQVQPPTGLITFKNLIAKGYLQSDGQASSGVIAGFDNCTKTSFLYQESPDQRFISYDDPQSWAAKGQFILDKKLAGFSIWHLIADSSDHLIAKSVRKGAGIDA